MSKSKRNRFLDFFGFGSGGNYDDDDYIEDEEDEEYEDEDENMEDEPPRYSRRSKSNDDGFFKRNRKPRVVPVQDRNSNSSVVIFSPKSYDDALPLVKQLVQRMHIIVKFDKVNRKVAQRILDFMSGAAYASDSKVTEVSKGTIYLFASNQTYINQADEMERPKEDGQYYTLDDD